MSRQKGVLITLEGGEGVGKSTLQRVLARQLRDEGVEVVETREPGGTAIANAIREIFAKGSDQEPIFPLTELMLVNAARYQHIRMVIEPALAAGKWILCDRFADSTVVYQSMVGGLGAEMVATANAWATSGIQPDLTLLLDCAVDVAQKRLSLRHGVPGQEKPTRYDLATRPVHERIRSGFLELSRNAPQRFAILDAAEETDQVAAKAWAIIKERLRG